MSMGIGDDLRSLMDSGIEWIDKIPRGWTVKPLKWIVKFGKGLPITKDNLVEQGIPVVSYGQIHSKTNNGTHLHGDLIRFVGETYLESNPLSLGKKGDIFFADTSEDYAGIGNAVLVDIDTPVFAGYHTVIVRPDDTSYSRYLAYLFLTDAWRSQLCSRASGIKVFSITQGLLKKTTIILPPTEKAAVMTDYLDRKCSQIDAIIARQQKVIEKLKEYRLSVITEAVTKGLNPNVPMKDSGDDFIGVMPKHWNVAKLGMLFDFLGGYAYSSDSYTSESDNQVIRIGNVKSGYIALENNPVYISNEIASATDKYRIKPGSILFTMTGTKGKRDYFFTHLVTEEDCKDKKLFLNQRVGCFIPKESIDAGYYSYLLKEKRILDAIFVYETGTANQGNLGIENIRRTKVQLPSKDEQVKIRQYLDNCCAKIEGLLTRKCEIVYRLIAYKKSLIYEVVTGKKEV